MRATRTSGSVIARYRTSLVLGLVGGLMALSLASSAHAPTVFYAAKWRSGTFNNLAEDQRVEWRFVKNFPRAGRGRVKDAAAAWNRTGAMRFVFERGPDYAALGSRCGSYQEDRIGWASFGGDRNTNQAGGKEPLATITPCLTNDKQGLFAFILKINRDYPWYMGRARPVPSKKIDLWSVVTHELGHATGFLAGGPTRNVGHWSDLWNTCPMNSARNSMCETVVKGSHWARHPGKHDRHTISNTYP